jgi:hypothetical protein
MVRIFLFHVPEFFEPDFDRPIGNQLNVLKTDNFVRSRERSLP